MGSDPGSATEAADKETVEVFHMPSWLRRWGLIGLGVFGTMLLLSLLGPDDGPRPVSVRFRLMLASFWILMSSLGVWMLAVSRRQIQVSREGVEQVLSPGKRRWLGWAEVASVESEDMNARILLFNRDRSCRIELDYQLERFDRLRQLVFERVPAGSMAGNMADKFVRAPFLLALHAVALWVWVVFAGLAGLQEPSYVAWGFIGFFLFTLISCLPEPQRVEVTRDGIEIHYPFRGRLLSYDALTGVGLIYRPGPNASVHATVELRRRDGKPVCLSNFKGGSLALHRSLEAAWRAHRNVGSGVRADPPVSC